MTIQELARKARVTPRTIRYYVEQGVLPPPGRGRPSEYTVEHQRRLALIRRLKEQYLPLEEIRDTMQRLTLDEVEELLTHSAMPQKESAKTTSASEYIASVLNQTAVREEMLRNSTQMPSQFPLPAAPPSSPAWEPMPSPAASDERQAPGGASNIHNAPSLAGPPLREVAQPQMEQSGIWQRITIAPGIELHYLLTNDAHINNIAAQILQAAQDILGANPGELSEETE